MHFRIDQRFAGSVEAVEAAFFDPEFLARLGRLPKLGRPELLDQVDTGSVLTQRVRYRFAGQLGPAVTAVVDPAKLTWVEESVLDRANHHVRFAILPDHYAGRLTCHGTWQLSADGDATIRLAEGEVVVRFPLVGGKVERAIVSGLEEHADAECEVLGDWLAEPRSP